VPNVTSGLSAWDEAAFVKATPAAAATAKIAAAASNPDPIDQDIELDFSPTINVGNFGQSSEPAMVILEPGEYTAEITNVIKAVHEASGKLPRCPQVTVDFAVTFEDGTVAICKKLYYIINRDWAWRQIYFLFKAASLIEGKTFTPEWDRLIGIPVHITVDDSVVNGRTYHNNVIRVDPYGKEDVPF